MTFWYMFDNSNVFHFQAVDFSFLESFKKSYNKWKQNHKSPKMFTQSDQEIGDKKLFFNPDCSV